MEPGRVAEMASTKPRRENKSRALPDMNEIPLKRLDTPSANSLSELLLLIEALQSL
jgi:hypothetical protein